MFIYIYIPFNIYLISTYFFQKIMIKSVSMFSNNKLKDTQ